MLAKLVIIIQICKEIAKFHSGIGNFYYLCNGFPSHDLKQLYHALKQLYQALGYKFQDVKQKIHSH